MENVLMQWSDYNLNENGSFIDYDSLLADDDLWLIGDSLFNGSCQGEDYDY